MLIIPPPQTNRERQRRFQAAHPGYDRRRKAAERAASSRSPEQMLAQWAALQAHAELAAKSAEAIEPSALSESAANVHPDPQLLLFPAMRAAA